jgi:uncharacterized protein YbbC (DUF1343 family)
MKTERELVPGILLRKSVERTIFADGNTFGLIENTPNMHFEGEDELFTKFQELCKQIRKEYKEVYPFSTIEIGMLEIRVIHDITPKRIEQVLLDETKPKPTKDRTY